MRRLLAAFLAVCCLLALCSAAGAEPGEVMEPETDSETFIEPETEQPTAQPEQTPAEILAGSTHISDVQITCTLQENGKASVTQQIEITFASLVNQVRFGFPADARNPEVEGRKTRTSEQDGVLYLTVESDGGFTGVHTFTLSYTQTGLVSMEETEQLLTLPLLAPQDYRIAALQFNVTLPQSFDGQPVFLSDYHGEQIEDTMTVTNQSSVITGMVNTLVQDHDALTMTLKLPDGYFSGSFGSGGSGTVLIVIIFLLMALTVLYWWRTLRSARLRVQARTLPPDGVNPGDLPYLLSGGSADFNMLVSYWATLGYLSIHVTAEGNVLLLRRMEMGNERRAYERKLFDLLFDGTDHCDGASTRYKRTGEKAMSVIPRYWGRRLYSKKSGSPVVARVLSALICALAMLPAMDAMAPDKLHGLMMLVAFVSGAALGWLSHYTWGAWYLSDWLRCGIGAGSALLLLILGGSGGAALVMTPAVALALLIGQQTTHGGLRTAYGDQVVSQTLGFRRFIRNASEHHAIQMLRRDPQYYYKMLPYAQAMGQGQRFAGLFRDVRMEPCQWYDAGDDTPDTAGAFYAHYCETLELLNVSIRK